MAYEITSSGKRCLKCGHVRTPADPAPDTACPACGAVYAKVEAAMRERRVAAMDADEDRELQAEVARPRRVRGAAETREGKDQLVAHLVYLLYALFVYLAWLALGLWFLYRTVKGWVYLIRGQLL